MTPAMRIWLLLMRGDEPVIAHCSMALDMLCEEQGVEKDTALSQLFVAAEDWCKVVCSYEDQGYSILADIRHRRLKEAKEVITRYIENRSEYSPNIEWENQILTKWKPLEDRLDKTIKFLEVLETL